MSLNAQEFAKRSEESFFGQYLTSVGIIQSISLGALVAQTFDKTGGGVPITQLLGSFLAIVLISAEYSWWILVVRRTPNVMDYVIPYALGFAEFGAIAHVADQSGAWFWTMGVLGLVGISSLLVNSRSCTEEVFQECPWLRQLTLRNLYTGSLIVVAMTAIMFILYTSRHSVTTTERNGYFLLFYSFGILMLSVSGVYLSRVKREFARAREQERDQNQPPAPH